MIQAAAAGTLWTIGHSTREWDVFVGMLREVDIRCLVDVRRFAGSRRNPQFSPEAMAPALVAAGIAYQPMPELGGRRVAQADSPNGAWRVAAFRGYADYMGSAEFVQAREQLMRAEALWWQCHRRLIADDFVAHHWDVVHLMAPGKQQPHPLNPDARMVDDVLRYPAAGDAQAALF